MSLKERGNVEDVEVLLVDLDVAHQPLKAVGPDADHESTGRGFFDRGDDVGERAVRERIVVVGPDVGHVHAGDAGKRAARARRCRRGAAADCREASRRGQASSGGGPGGYIDRRHRVYGRAERVVRAERRRGQGHWARPSCPAQGRQAPVQAQAEGPRPTPGLASGPATLPRSEASSTRHRACPWAGDRRFRS